MKKNSSNRILLVSFTLAILFSFNLSIPQLVQNSEAYPSVYVSQIAAKDNPFYKSSGAGQVIYDYFPTSEKKVSNANTNDLINQLINSLIQEQVAKPEICGDGQDNDGNGQIDEYCDVSNIPPQDDNQSPQVEPEQEICGDGQDNDGNGQIDEYCDVSNIPLDIEQSSEDNNQQDDSQLTDEKKNFDKFGVTKIYPTKKDGEQWYLKSNPNSDTRFSPQTTLTKNPDGSFKIKSTKVRMGVFTSSGFHPEEIKTLDHNKIALAGYMQSPNDWKDVEITGYVKLNSGNNDNFVWYARGARHTGYGSPQGCEGVAYKGDLFYDGSTRFSKEQWHTGGYVFGEFGKNIGPIKDKWVGLKVIMYNIVQDDKTMVKLELWLDKNNNNDWTKAAEKIDKGGWGNTGGECGGEADQIITWGGPIASFRWDGATDVDIKKFSVREIAPLN
ncbi:MAG TPA: hypothetical protein VFY55_04120 [Nitrososphaeraceae archaeon]|nr:hypothetical protein [Nitrososphaeraceae archaeon]